MHGFIARDPILDRHERVYGYEVLSRSAEEVIWPPLNGSGSGSTAPPGAQALQEIDDITEGERAFIKCTRQALIGGHPEGLPRERVVLELRAPMQPDHEVMAACRALKDAGYIIALENFQPAQQEPLAELADILKLDVTASSDRTQWLLMRKYRPRGTVFVAQKVDKRTQFQAAVQGGYSYFQGQFFCRPQPYSASEVAPIKLVYLLVLKAVTRPEINVQEIAETIKHDLALSYKLLRFLNSARFAFHSQIKSIRHALLLLGQNEIRKWIGLISLAALGEEGPPILVKMALIRAAFCEALARMLGEPQRESDYFFLGLLSGIDVLLRRPIRVVLSELPMASDVSAALMGEPNPLRDVLQMVIHYERGNWGECSQLANKLEVQDEKLCDLYLQALRWSRGLTTNDKDEPVEAACS
jgi:EAL and modified HD-GYP domain-containing signal transduction protein